MNPLRVPNNGWSAFHLKSSRTELVALAQPGKAPLAVTPYFLQRRNVVGYLKNNLFTDNDFLVQAAVNIDTLAWHLSQDTSRERCLGRLSDMRRGLQERLHYAIQEPLWPAWKRRQQVPFPPPRRP